MVPLSKETLDWLKANQDAENVFAEQEPVGEPADERSVYERADAATGGLVSDVKALGKGIVHGAATLGAAGVTGPLQAGLRGAQSILTNPLQGNHFRAINQGMEEGMQWADDPSMPWTPANQKERDVSGWTTLRTPLEKAITHYKIPEGVAAAGGWLEEQGVSPEVTGMLGEGLMAATNLPFIAGTARAGFKKLTGLTSAASEARARHLAEKAAQGAKETIAPADIEAILGMGGRPTSHMWSLADDPGKKGSFDFLGSKLPKSGEQGESFLRRVPDEDAWFVKSRYGSQRNKSSIHYNGKTGLSVDFCTDCARRHGLLGPCFYCYVESGRIGERLDAEGIRRPSSGKKFNTTSPKQFVSHDYRGELAEMPDSVVQALNQDGGLRMFSFGDYRPDKDFDNVKRLLDDAQRRGLFIKAITKEPKLLEHFGNHPNLRVNLSIDNMPKHLTNAVSLDEAIALKAKYPNNVRIRAVALNPAEAEMYGANKNVDVVTLYHGHTGDDALAIIKRQNPDAWAKYEDEIRQIVGTWENMSPESKYAKDFQRRNPRKTCCIGGSCAADPTKCGFGGSIENRQLSLDPVRQQYPEFYEDDPLRTRVSRHYQPKLQDEGRRSMFDSPEWKAEMARPKWSEETKINGITKGEATDMLVAGDPAVLPHIEEGVKKHGKLAMMDEMINGAMTKSIAKGDKKFSGFKRLEGEVRRRLK